MEANKMIQVSADTHRKLKLQAAIRGETFKEYMAWIATQH